MTTPIYVSAGSFDIPLLGDIMNTCIEHGLTGVELGSSCQIPVDELKRIIESSSHVPELLIHNYFPRPETPFVLNLASDSPLIRARSVAHCIEAIDLCTDLTLPFYSFHAGFAVDAVPGQLGGPLCSAPRFSKAKAYRNFVKSLDELCGYAAEKDIRLLIENNVVIQENLVNGQNELLLGADAGELLEILAEVNSPVLGLLVDTGHLKVTARSLGFDREAFLLRVAGKVGAFHLSDNDGVSDSHLEFAEDAWFLSSLADFRHATLILETRKNIIAKIKEMAAIIRKITDSNR